MGKEHPDARDGPSAPERRRRRRLLVLAGLVPIAAGVFDVCLLAPLLDVPFRGEDARRRFWW